MRFSKWVMIISARYRNIHFDLNEYYKKYSPRYTDNYDQCGVDIIVSYRKRL